MILTNKYTQTLIEIFPNFGKSKHLQEAMELEADGEYVNACTVFTALTDYVVYELINKNNEITKEEIDIYNYIEETIKCYRNFPDNTAEKEWDSAACCCFLENLINIASAGRILYDRFIPYLGEKSKEFCRAWDEFTGVKSPGLW